MKRTISVMTAIILLSINVNAQGAKQVYESPKLKETIAKHKLVAILPYKATITYKRLPKNFDSASNREQERTLATNMQSGMYTYLLRKADSYSVTFQETDRTNILLKSAGVFDKLDEMLPDSLCRLLKVDAIVKCSYAYEKTGSEGGAIVKTVLLGAGTGKVASGALTMQIYNGGDGELLWRFYKEMNEDVMSSANAMMERMMRKVSRNFPYEK